MVFVNGSRTNIGAEILQKKLNSSQERSGWEYKGLLSKYKLSQILNKVQILKKIGKIVFE